MNLQLSAFTDRGMALAESLAEKLGGQAMRCGEPLSLSAWTETHFDDAEALVFVGAAAIAVRAVAPFLRSKTRDPAVVAVDETGTFAVALLSGHLGGANDLCRRVAAITGGTPVITTATDRRGLFPVDQWARTQGLAVGNPGEIKAVSGRILAGETVTLRTDWPIAGEPPPGVVLTEKGEADVAVSFESPEEGTLWLIPRNLSLGVGCRKGAPAAAMEAAFSRLMGELGLPEQAVCRVCTIERKASEPGLQAFCRDRRLPLETFSPEALAALPGDFTASDFVRKTVGVDNVCERAAVLGSGGSLIAGKHAGQGVTLAIARENITLDWSW